jgi:hypothetical protein
MHTHSYRSVLLLISLFPSRLRDISSSTYLEGNPFNSRTDAVAHRTTSTASRACGRRSGGNAAAAAAATDEHGPVTTDAASNAQQRRFVDGYRGSRSGSATGHHGGTGGRRVIRRGIGSSRPSLSRLSRRRESEAPPVLLDYVEESGHVVRLESSRHSVIVFTSSPHAQLWSGSCITAMIQSDMLRSYYWVL